MIERGNSSWILYLLVMNDDLMIAPDLSVPRGELRFAFARSGGKGGQNVNKVETKVELLFDVARSPVFNDEQRRAILTHLRSRVDADGVLHIVAQKSRSQWKNRKDAIQKFVLLMRHALRPRKERVHTGVPVAAKQKRLDEKKRRSEVKRMRSSREF